MNFWVGGEVYFLFECNLASIKIGWGDLGGFGGWGRIF